MKTKPLRKGTAPPPETNRVLAIDIGGTNVKLLVTGARGDRKIPSGPALTPREMATKVKAAVKDWVFDMIGLH